MTPVAQRIEQRFPKPCARVRVPAGVPGRSVAQLVERRSPKPKVGGSNPPAPAI